MCLHTCVKGVGWVCAFTHAPVLRVADVCGCRSDSDLSASPAALEMTAVASAVEVKGMLHPAGAALLEFK